MSEVFRRVILKPDGLSDEVSAALAKSLDGAVKAQQRLASKSPHVLQLVGSLQENEKAFFVDHEPAQILISSPDLFSPDTPTADSKRLLQITVAVLDALRAVHSGAISPIRAHGGVCPGVMVKTTEGVEKLTDFSFAPAICTALDTDHYLNLAVGKAAESTVDGIISGQWEVLSPDEYDREDRICAFIDPEKYGTGMMDGFEPGSDIIAAGIYLHLLAEHQHPYLQADPDAHRMVDMSEFMAQNLFNNARRQDLRESEDAAVKLWCDLLAKMLARLPKDRPSAAEATESLSAYVKPIDAGELLRRQLEKLKKQVDAGPPDDSAWKSIEQNARAIADNESAATDVRESAARILRLTEARSIVGQAEALLGGDNWRDARPLLDRLPNISELPADLEPAASQCIALLRQYTEVTDQLTSIRVRLDNPADSDPSAALALLDEYQESLSQIVMEASLPTSVQKLHADLQTLLDDRRLTLAEQQVALEKEAALANEWLAGLEESCDAEDWTGYSDRAVNKPDIAHWPKDAAARQNAQQLRFEEYGQARSWLDQLLGAHDGDAWKEAFRLVGEEPALSNWPPTLRKEADELIARIREVQSDQEDEARAHKWIADLANAVESKNWAAAGAVLDGRPDIQKWPDGFEAREKEFRGKIAEHIADEERETLAKAEAKRLAAEWLAEAQALATQKDWDPALAILKRPPEIGYFPEETRRQADELIKVCTGERDAAIRKRHQKRIESATANAMELVEQILSGELAPIVSADLLASTVEQFEIEAHGSEGLGSATLSIGLRSGKDGDIGAPIELPFQFTFENESATIADSEPPLAEAIATKLTAQLLDRQRAGLSDLIRPLRSGLFPGAELEGKLDAPAEQTVVKIQLAAESIETRELSADLQWDPRKLTWRFADNKQLVKPMLDIVGVAAQGSVPTKLLENSKLLQQYRNHISCDISVAAPQDGEELPRQLAVRAALTLRTGQKSEPAALATVDLSCTDLARFDVTSDPDATERALSTAIVTQQTAASETLRKGIVERISKAPVKARLDMRPKQISEPTDDLQFDVKCLTCKKRPAGALAANWNAETFEFETAKTWTDELDAVLVAPRKGETGPPVALMGGGALAAVALIIVVVTVTGGSADKTTPEPNLPPNKVVVNDNTSENPAGGGDGQPPVIEKVLPTDEAITDATRRLLAVLAQSRYLKPIVEDESHREQILKSSSTDSGLPWEINIPGLKDNPLAVTLEEGEDLEAKLGQIFTSLTQLDEMLNLGQSQTIHAQIDEAIRDVIDEQAWREFVVADSVRSEQLTLPDGLAMPWTLQDGQWRTSDANCELRIHFEDTEEEPIPVGPINVHLLAQAGEIALASSADELGTQLNQLFPKLLRERQQKSANDLENKLKTDLQSSGMVAAVAWDATQVAEPIGDISLTASTATLRPRDFSAPWDAPSLTFVAENAPTPWPEVIAQFKMADDVLAELNSQLNTAGAPASSDWLRRATREPLRELDTDDFNWTLAAVAPWPVASSANHPPPPNLLPLELNAAILNSGGSPSETAASILSTELSPPTYWPLVEEYLLYKGTATGVPPDPYFLAGDRAVEWDTATSSAEFKQDVLPYWRSSQPVVVPAVTLNDRRTRVVVADDSVSPSQLTMEFATQWGLARTSPRSPQQLSSNAFDLIQQALNDQFGQALPCNLSASIGRSGAPDLTWSGLEPAVDRFVETLPQVKFLDEGLATLDARSRLEDQLEAALPGDPGTSVTISPEDASNYLAAIWEIKGESLAGASPVSVAANLVQAHGNARGRLSNKWATAKPALFVEFFCGPKTTYAIAWSVNEGQVVEGPTLLKLCSRTEITGTGSATNLGEALLGAVFGSMPKSIRRSIDFDDKEIGIVLAPDTPMQLVNLPALRFSKQTSTIEQQNTGLTRPQEWRSLQELHDKKDYNCAFRICRSLATYNKKWSPRPKLVEALRWATTTIDNAGQTQ